MPKIRWFLLGICLSVFMFSACGSSPAPDSNSAAEARAAAQAALDRMDGKEPAGSQPSPNTPAANTPAANTPATQEGTAPVNTSKTKPAWVDSVDSVYNRAQYVAAVGYAADRTMAERSALANLTAIFGQSIRADQTITNTYQEAVRNGVTAGWTDNIAMANTINISTSMDTLIGAEIREVWFDSLRTYYAVAAMEKAKAIPIYNDLINANKTMINNLITMPPAEKNSLEGFTRYQFAATVADINITYGNVLQVIGAPRRDLEKGDTYRMEAQNIARSIPIGITVKNDKSGRIQGAFAKALSDLGFRSGGNNSRYVLEVDITVSEVPLNNLNKFARIELGANLTDTGQRTVLLPYNFNQREGHSTYSEAENRTYLAAERKINEEYAQKLNEYLSSEYFSKVSSQRR